MKRYAIVGASARALTMYASPIATDFPHTASLVGILDPNPLRARYVSAQAGDPPVFADLSTMLREAAPDSVIVASMDRFHPEAVVAALDAGADVICEKPLCVDAAGARAILAAEERTGRKIVVILNSRLAPYVARIKELVRDGAIGNVLGVDFEWFLDTRHGADYFRRWHRRVENSGGILVTKATHHFDMIDWWLADEPTSVYARGALRFYGATRTERGERCSTCRYTRTCEFYVDMAADPMLKGLYFDAESADGYHRDGCVFSPDINTWDTMSLSVGFRGGAMMSYSCVTHSPYEGWRVALNGTDGRLEAQEFHSGARAAEPSDALTIFDRRGASTVVSVPKLYGQHGGADRLLRDRLFGGVTLPDPLGMMAGSRDGALSALVGIAANESIATGAVVEVEHLLKP